MEKNKNEIVSKDTIFKSKINYGNESKYWNPKMKEFILGKKIITDLATNKRRKINLFKNEKIRDQLEIAYQYLLKKAQENSSFLIVGTKNQFLKDTILKEAKRAQIFYIANKWQGGLLTNIKTLIMQGKKLTEIEKKEVDGTFKKLKKNEILKIKKEYSKLIKNFEGVRKMVSPPDVLIVLDSKKNYTAIEEAKKLKIPVVALLNSDCKRKNIKIQIPGNDNRKKSLLLVTKILTDAICVGKKIGEPEYAYKESIDFSFLDYVSQKVEENNKDNSNKYQKTLSQNNNNVN